MYLIVVRYVDLGHNGDELLKDMCVCVCVYIYMYIYRDYNNIIYLFVYLLNRGTYILYFT